MAKRVLIAVAVVLLLLQFVRPRRELAEAGSGTGDFISLHRPPEAVQAVLRNACYDCHSSGTRYPWYAQVQPFGWWLVHHVKEGKSELNLSEFGSYPKRRQLRKLNQMSESLTQRTMPLRSYTWLHPDARLTEQQVQMVSVWLDELHDRISGE